jgi:hypothetical protein
MQQMEAHYDFIGSFTLVRRSPARVVSKKLAQGQPSHYGDPAKCSHAFKENTRTIEPFAPQLAGS